MADAPDIRTVLDPLPVDQTVKAEVWNHFYGASSPDDFKQRFDQLQIPTEAKSALWNLKFNPGGSATPAPAAPQAAVNNPAPVSPAGPMASTPVNNPAPVSAGLMPQSGGMVQGPPQFTGPLANPKDPTSRLPSAQEAMALGQQQAKQYVDGVVAGTTTPQILSDEPAGADLPYPIANRPAPRGLINSGLSRPENEVVQPADELNVRDLPGGKLLPNSVGGQQLPEIGPLRAYKQFSDLVFGALDLPAPKAGTSKLDAAVDGVLKLTTSLSTPETIATVLGGAGLGELIPYIANLPKVASALKNSPKLAKGFDMAANGAVSGAFAADMATGAYQGGKEAIAQYKQGNVPGAVEAGTRAAGSALLAGLAGRHALGEAGEVAGQHPAEGDMPAEALPGTPEAAAGVPVPPSPKARAEAPGKAASLRAEGQNIAAEQWQNIADYNKPVEVDLGGGEKGTVVQRKGEGGRGDYAVIDAAGKVRVAGDGEAVGHWLRERRIEEPSSEAGGGISVGAGAAEAADLPAVSKPVKVSASAGGSLTESQYQAAVEHVQDQGETSVGQLQRKFKIGYGRATKMLDRMESEGIIGPADGSKPRQVLASGGNATAATPATPPEKGGATASPSPEEPAVAPPSAEKSDENDYAEQMKAAETADEGRSIIAAHTDEINRIETGLGLKPTVGQIEKNYSRGFSTLKDREQKAMVKRATAIDPAAGARLQTLVDQGNAMRPTFEALYQSESGQGDDLQDEGLTPAQLKQRRADARRNGGQSKPPASVPTADQLVQHYTDNNLQPAPGTTATPEEIRAGAELAIQNHNAQTQESGGEQAGENPAAGSPNDREADAEANGAARPVDVAGGSGATDAVRPTTTEGAADTVKPPTPQIPNGTWMNDGDIDRAVARHKDHPVLSRATRFLRDFADETNKNSDGWHSWAGPQNAAKQLMGMIQRPEYATEENFKTALAPIRAFYTKRGKAAGLKFPEIAPAPKPAKKVNTALAEAAAAKRAEKEAAEAERYKAMDERKLAKLAQSTNAETKKRANAEIARRKAEYEASKPKPEHKQLPDRAGFHNFFNMLREGDTFDTPEGRLKVEKVDAMLMQPIIPGGPRGQWGAIGPSHRNVLDVDLRRPDDTVQKFRQHELEQHLFGEKPQAPKPAAPKPAAEPTGGNATPAPPAAQGTADQRMIARIRKAIDSGEDIRLNLEKLAEQNYGGTRASGAFDKQKLYELQETAMNQWLADNGPRLMGEDFDTAVKEIRAKMRILATQTVRSDEKIRKQQFSTPPQIAYLADRLLAAGKQDTVLEPSAGTGTLVSALRDTVGAVHVNEIDPERAALMGEVGFQNPTGHDGEVINALLDPKVKPTRIIMNPPFSSSALKNGGKGAVRGKSIFGYNHLKSALQRLAPGGRLVAIMGGGTDKQPDQGASLTAPSITKMWQGIAGEYTIRANVRIAGKEYAKNGTTFGTRVIVIDKTGPTPGANWLEQLANIERSDYDTVEQVWSRLSVLANAPRGAGAEAAPVSANTGNGEAPGQHKPGSGVASNPGGVHKSPERAPSRSGEAGKRTESETRRGDDSAEHQLPAVHGGTDVERDRGGEPGPEHAGPATPATPERGGSATERAGTPTDVKPKTREEILEAAKLWLKPQADAARARLLAKMSGTRATSGIDPQDLLDLATVGADYVLDGALTFKKWLARAADELGEIITRYAEREQREIYGKALEKAEEGMEAGTSAPPPEEKPAEKPAPQEPAPKPLEVKSAPVAPKEPESEDAGAFVTYHPRIEGKAHVGDIVESKSMATVSLPPFTYKPSLPADIDISAIQMESVIIAGQQNERENPDGTRAAALIGDGTGVGKGRTVAAIVLDNWNKGRRRILWVSKSWPLLEAAKEDLANVGAPELAKGLKPLNKLHKGGKAIAHEGVIFATYDLLRSKDAQGNTVSALVDQWLKGSDQAETAYVAWDESHTMKNTVPTGRSKPSQVGLKTHKLRVDNPKLRMVFLSATAASDVVNFGYLERLGLWGAQTPFPTGFNHFVSQIGEGGVAAMELIARELKATGKYIARTLSYRGVTHDVVPHNLNPDQKKLYREAAKAWADVTLEVEKALQTINGGRDARSVFMNNFWGGHQRFFNLLITALKLPTALEEADKALADKKAVVITLVNTNEAAQDRQEEKQKGGRDDSEGGGDEEDDDLDFGPKDILTDLIRRHYPVQQWVDELDDNGKLVKKLLFHMENGKQVPTINETAREQRDALIKHLEESLRVPENPLDILINHFGRANVAELTGRTKYYDAATREFVKRGGSLPRRLVNLAEMAAFQNDEKQVAVLSAAAGTGISLQAGLSVKNQRTRVHITLQPGWSADKAMQMLGRTHRTNQKQAPQYKTIASDLSGEKRFTATIAKRLATMGALTRGSTEASGAEGMEKADYFGSQGIEAAHTFTQNLLNNRNIPGVSMSGRAVLTEMGMLKTDPRTGEVTADVGQNPIGRILNRFLALDPDLQNKAFEYFHNIFEEAVEEAIERGTLDTGVRELSGDRFSIEEQRPIATDPETKAKTFYYRVSAETDYKLVTSEDLDKEMKKHPDGVFYIDRTTGGVMFAVEANPVTHTDGRVTEAIRYITTSTKNWTRIPKPGPGAHYQEIGAKRAADLVAAQEKLAKAKKKVSELRASRLGATAYQRRLEAEALAKGLTPARRGKGKYPATGGNLVYDLTKFGVAPTAIRELQEAQREVAEAEEAAAQNPLEVGRQAWEDRVKRWPKSFTEERHMIGGAVLKHWNSLKPYVRSQSGGIRLARDTKTGERIVGVVVPQADIAPVVGQIGGGTVQVTPDQIVNDVLSNGTEYQLQSIRVKRTNVARIPVVQLIPADAPTGRVLIDRFHVQYEKGLAPVYYIPEVTKIDGYRLSARELLGRIMKDFPLAVKRLAGDQSGSVSINTATLGLSKFWRSDVAPALAKAAKGMVEAKDDILRMFAPGARGPRAAATHGELRYTAAELARRMDRAHAALEEAGTVLMRLPEAVRWDFVDRIEHGTPQANLHLQAIANILRAMLDDARTQVQQLGTGKLESFYENYFPHIWKDPKRAAGVFGGILARRPFEGRKSFLKQRSIITIADGLAAHLEPISDNPLDLVLAKLGEMNKYIMARNALEVEKAAGRMKFGRGLNKPKGVSGDWRVIDDAIATVYGPRTPQGAATIRGRYWAPEESALLFNNYLSPGLRAKSGLFRAYMGAGNVLLQFQLGWSAFHATFVSLEAMTSRFALGIYQANHGAVGQGLRSMAVGLTPVPVVQNLRMGAKIQRAWDRPGTQAPLIEQMANAVVQAGGRARMDSSLRTNMTVRMMDAFRQGNIIGGLLRVPFAATEQVARPVMEFLVPRMKLGAFAKMAEFEIQRLGPGAKPEQVRAALGKAWDSIDNRFGQLVYDNLAWNRIAKDLAQASVRTVGWNVGDISELGGGVIDAGKGLLDAPKKGRFEITHPLSYLMAIPVVVGLYGGIVNFLMTGELPKELLDFYYPRDGEGGRMSMASYVKEVVSLFHDPIGWGKAKLHPLLTLMADMLTNRDYFNKPIANADDPLVERAAELAAYPIRVAEPISIQGWERNQGKSLKQQVLPFIGLPRAPKYIGGDEASSGHDDELDRLLGREGRDAELDRLLGR